MMPSVKTQVGDVHFDFNDSCNCCCWGRSKLKDDKAAFIKKDGKVEVLDPSKTADLAEANRLTILRLESTLAGIARQKSMHPDQLKARVKKETGYDIDPVSPQKLNVGQLRRIDTIFQKIRKEPDSPPVRVPSPQTPRPENEKKQSRGRIERTTTTLWEN